MFSQSSTLKVKFAFADRDFLLWSGLLCLAG